MDAGTVEGALVMRDLATAVIGRVDEALGRLDKSMGSSTDAANKLGSGVDALGSKLSKIGGAFSDIGTNLSIGLTAPLVAASGIALKFSTDFEAAMTKVSTLSGIGADEIKGMSDAVLDMAGKVGKTPQELATALTVITSTGIKGAAALDILRKSAEAATVGLGDTKDVARAVVSAVKAYESTGLDAARATEILFKAVKDGGAEANEFAGTLGRVVGIASQLGVSFEEVTGFVATYSRLGVDAAEATTALRASMIAFLQPTAAAEKALAGIGTSAQEVREQIKQKGLQAAFQDLMTAFKGDEQAIADVFGNARALAGVLGTVGSQAKDNAAIIDHLKQNTNELGTAFEQTQKTAQFSFQALTAQAQAVAITFGNTLAPSLKKVLDNIKPILDSLGDLVKKFADLPAPVQQAAIVIAAILGAAGPIAFAIGGTISAIGTLRTAIIVLGNSTGITAGLKALATTITTIGTSAEASAIGVTILKGAIAGLVIAAVLIYLDQCYQKIQAIGKAREDLEKQMVDDRATWTKANELVGHQVKDLTEAKGVMASYQAGLQGLKPDLGAVGKLTTDMALAWQKGKEEAGGLAAEMPQVITGFGGIKAVVGPAVVDHNALVAAMKAARIELAGLSGEQLRNIQAGLAMHKSDEDIIKATGIHADALNLLKAQLEKTASATQRAAEAQKKLIEEFTGSKALEDFQTRLKGIADILGGDFSKLTRDQLEALKKEVDGISDRFRQMGQTIPADVQAAGAAIDAQLSIPIRNAKEWADQLGASLKDAMEKGAAASTARTQRVDVIMGNDKVGEGAKTANDWALAIAKAKAQGLNFTVQMEKAAAAAAVIDEAINELRRRGEPIPSQWEETAQALHDASDGAEELNRHMETGKKIGLGQTIKDSLKDAFGGTKDFGKDLVSTIVGAIQGGGSVLQSVGSMVGGKAMGGIGEGLGKAAAGAIGGKLGGIVGGIMGPLGGALGSAMGALGGKLIGKLFGADTKAGNELKGKFQDQMGGIDELNKKAKDAGLSLDALFKAKGSKQVQAEITKLQEGIKKADEETKKLIEDFGKAAESGEIIGKKMWAAMLSHKDRDDVKKALADVFKSATSQAAAGFNKIGENITGMMFPKGADLDRVNKEITDALAKGQPGKFAPEFIDDVEKQLARVGPLAEAAFGALTAQGMSAVEAINQMGPGLQRLSDLMAATGTHADGFLGTILGWQGVIDKNKELFETLSGVSDMLTGLSNSGLLTQKTFDSLAGIVTDAFSTLEGQGVSADDALRLMQPQLQKLWEASKMWNLTLDDGTKALLEQAEAAGLVGEKFKSPQEQMLDGINKMVSVLETLTKGLGIDLPAAAQKGADGIEDKFKDIHIDIPVGYDYEQYKPPTGAPGGSGPPPMAAGGVVRQPSLVLAGEAGPEAIVPLDRLEQWMRNAGSGGGGTSAEDIRAGVLAALRESGLADLGSGSGRADAIDKHIAPAIPGALNRNQETRTRTLIALGFEAS